MIRLAVIGFGLRVSGMVRIVMTCDPGEVRLVAIADPNVDGVHRMLREAVEVDPKDVRIFRSADELLEHAGNFDAILIGTRCHLHTPMAMKVARTGLPLFLEKPVAITTEQLVSLQNAFCGREESVVVSFPLRLTPLFSAVNEVVQSGRLGTINQIQAVNNVYHGGVYFGQWYRNYDEVGGLWLQKATHDFDYLNLLMNSPPTAIFATETHKIYGGQMPHDLKCSGCDQTETCLESPTNITRRGDDGGMGKGDHWCAFSRDIRNEDAGSAIVTYGNGAHVSYVQNFVTRRSAGRRGAIITGYRGTLEFDWVTESMRIVDHHINRVDQIEVKASYGHAGGDEMLAQSFLDVIRKRSPSRSPLGAGLLSVAMCLAARESAHAKTLQPIPSLECIPKLKPGTSETTPVRTSGSK